MVPKVRNPSRGGEIVFETIYLESEERLILINKVQCDLVIVIAGATHYSLHSAKQGGQRLPRPRPRAGLKFIPFNICNNLSLQILWNKKNDWRARPLIEMRGRACFKSWMQITMIITKKKKPETAVRKAPGFENFLGLQKKVSIIKSLILSSQLTSPKASIHQF